MPSSDGSGRRSAIVHAWPSCSPWRRATSPRGVLTCSSVPAPPAAVPRRARRHRARADPPSEYTALGRPADLRTLAAMLDEGLEVLSGLWSGQPFTHHGAHDTFDDVQFLPPPLQQPRIPVWSGR